MTTFQSQIDILATNIIELYNKIDQAKPNNFSLVKLDYNSSSLNLPDNPSFQSLPTYVLAMDIDNSFPCTQYDVDLNVYESTVDGHTFQYVVPSKYTQIQNQESSYSISSFTSEFIHCNFSDQDNLKLLFNFPQVINLGSSLTLNSRYFTESDDSTYASIDYSKLLKLDNDETITKRNVDLPQTKKTKTEIITQLRDLKSQNEAQCIDLINEKLESLIYNNIYEITENGNLILKEHTNHPLKKNMNVSTSENIYILECDSNVKYLLEC